MNVFCRIPKVVSLILAATALLFVAACGGSSSGGGGDNVAPSITAPVDQNITRGTALNGVTVTATDANAADTLTFSVAALGTPSRLTIDPTTGVVNWTPTFDQIGTHNVTFSVSDGTTTVSDTVTFVVVPAVADSAAPLAGGTLDPLSIPKYVTPLVIPPVMNPAGAVDSYDIAVRQFKQQILPGGIWNTVNGRNDNFPATDVWSYGPDGDAAPDSSALGGGVGIAPAPNSQFNYPAYTIETLADTSVSVRWVNDLTDDNGNYLPHLLTVDQTLHWANPVMTCLDGSTRTDCMGESADAYIGPVPIVTHVHGAHVAGHSDGYPEAWWLPAANDLPDGIATSGTMFDDSTGTNAGDLGYADYVYRNDQPATTLWYHDHSLGMTRVNVYAGPAGFWLVRGDHNGSTSVVDAIDDQGTVPINDGTLPGPAPMAGDAVLELNIPGDPLRNAIREIPIVIQGRSFNQDGSLFYPERRAFFEGLDPAGLIIDFAGDPDNPTDIAPLWNPEAFFNVMVVNGVSWPKLDVAQATYRFRLLNGCNSRFLNLSAFKVDPLTGQIDSSKELPFYQIGTDQGALPNVIKISTGFATVFPGNGTTPIDTVAASTMQAILMGPAERADTLVDFSGTYVDGSPIADGDVIRIINTAADAPYGGLDPDDVSDATTSGQVMQFVISSTLNGATSTDPTGATPATAVADINLNPEPAISAPSAVTRQISLNEESSHDVCATTDSVTGFILQIDPAVVPPYDPTGLIIPGDTVQDFEDRCHAAGGEEFGPKAALLGTVDLTGPEPVGIPLLWTDTSGVSTPADVIMANGSTVQINVTENPTAGDTEQWEIYNFTEDAHPIHLHLVRFEVIERRVIGEPAGPGGANIEKWEVGYKDTVIAYPGEITVVKATYDLPGLYVLHCHILEHEDNEMMRPYVVSP
jgi:spore coat protein A